MIEKSKIRVGFTLIELLIVIVIIGALAAIFFANYLGVQQRARDSKRKSDLKQIQLALELINSDTGSYPYSLYPVGGDCPTSSSLRAGTPAVTYMAKIPCDPSSITYIFLPPGNYYYYSDGSTYTLRSCIENTNDLDQNIFTVIFPASCTTGKYYQLTGP